MAGAEERMTQVVAAAAPVMKESGFRRRRHSFNRSVGDDGVVHVLAFQMGSFEPPGTGPVPGLHPNLYGQFTVNLGVHVPAMRRFNPRKEGWINEYDCEVRDRLGIVATGTRDVWWPLDQEDVAAEIVAVIREHALPWLDRLRSNRDVLAIFEAHGRDGVPLPPAGPLAVADVYTAVGNETAARAVLTDYATQQHPPGHAEYLVRYFTQRGLHELARKVSG